MALITMACIQPMNAQQRENGPRRMNPEKMMQQRITEMDKELDLTDEQEKEIKKLYTDFYKNTPRERGSREEMMKRMSEFNEKVKAVLNDEQKVKFDKMNKNQRRRGSGGRR